MATSVPKSYQHTIKHPGPASPTSGQAGPSFPHTYTHNIFQVPDGKAWQVLKMIMLTRPPTDTVSFWQIEKTSSGGVEQTVLKYIDGFPGGADKEGIELPLFRDLVLEDQEIIRQLVKVSGPQIKYTVQHEMSVIEFTP